MTESILLECLYQNYNDSFFCSSIFRPSAHLGSKLGLETNSRWQVDHYIIKPNLLSHINSAAQSS